MLHTLWQEQLEHTVKPVQSELDPSGGNEDNYWVNVCLQQKLNVKWDVFQISTVRSSKCKKSLFVNHSWAASYF